MRFKKIYIEITNYCNKNCSFCSINKRKKIEMSPTSFNHIINEIKPYTNYLYLHVKGEPLLHSKFDEIIDICSSNDMNVNITTNGSFMKKQANILKNKSIRQINISFQSYENDINESEIMDIINTSNNLLNGNSNLNIVYRFWAINDNEFSINNKKIIEIIKKEYNLSPTFISDLLNHKNIKISDRLYVNIAEQFEWPNLDNDFTSFYGKCLGTCNHIGILVDGTVIPCCLDSNGCINFGNIFEKSLEEILNSERFVKMNQNIHENKFNEKLCQHCSYKNRFSLKKDK